MEGRAPSASWPSLDPLSPVFDPLQALQPEVEQQVALPFPDVHACDSLDTYQSLVQGKAARSTRTPSGQERPRDTCHASCIQGFGRQVLAGDGGVTQDGQSTDKTPDKASRTTSVPAITSEPRPRREERKKTRTVLNVMEGEVEGPIKLLQECLRGKSRVRVVIRHCAGVRGKCKGFLLAFDKHWNLVLGDVEEEYVPFTPGGAQQDHRRRRRRRKRRKEWPLVQPDEVETEPVVECEPDKDPVLEHGAAGQRSKEVMHRHVHQLFIRGDNIVLVQCIKDHPPYN